MMLSTRAQLACLLLLAIALPKVLADPQRGAQVDAAAAKRIAQMSIVEGLQASLWADETQIQNPGYFSFDSRGRMMMVEINRVYRGVGDVRRFGEHIAEDIAIKSLNDRKSLYQKLRQDKAPDYFTAYSDTIRLLSDADSNGRADTSTLFATGFNDPLDGLAGGVIERDNKVYFANIPSLWQLEDTNNDGTADKRTSLLRGFGLRVGLQGHDMHGLTWGPEGKLYWTIGDRGYDVQTKEGTRIQAHNSGAVFRANKDGSELEVFATGVRNSPELAFDHYGNLFTVDNDGDGGDAERVHFLIEGANVGWHAGHQTLISFADALRLRSHRYTNTRPIPNTWMANAMWKPRHPHQPAYILPAIGNIDGGPAGFSFNPSNNLGEQWRNTFFVALYKGAPSRSRIAAFTVKDDGAGFLANKERTVVSGFNSVGVDFGPDGRLYASEFNYGGWVANDEGAVYAFSSRQNANAKKEGADRALLTSSFSALSNKHLAALLSYDHQQVRQRAQFELAERGIAARDLFLQLAEDPSGHELSRIHAIWGLNQMANSAYRTHILREMRPLAKDANPQIRIQAIRTMGDHRFNEGLPDFIRALNDTHPRVAMYAAIGLGRIHSPLAIPALEKAIAANGGRDLWLRHAFVMALSGKDKSTWQHLKQHPSPEVRMVVVLALRKLNDPSIAEFLADADDAVVSEAIIAISDKALIPARQKLAAYLERLTPTKKPSPALSSAEKYLHHRVINANYNEGSIASVERLFKYASNPHLDPDLRSEAIAALEAWHDINSIDSVTGLPQTANPVRADMRASTRKYLPNIIENADHDTVVQSMRLASRYRVDIPTELMLKTLSNTETRENIRVQIVNELVKRQATTLHQILVGLLDDPHPVIRGQALNAISTLNGRKGIRYAKKMLARENTSDKQAALRVLTASSNKIRRVDRIALGLMRDLSAQLLPKGIILETLDLARSRNNRKISTMLSEFESHQKSQHTVDQYIGALEGGSAAKGKKLFYSGGQGECVRCHSLTNSGSNVGPNLSNIGDLRSRRYLLAALVSPSDDIAPGYGFVTVTLDTNTERSGIYMGKDDTFMHIINDQKRESIPLKSIVSAHYAMSGMPAMSGIFTKYQLRDIVAYLASLKNLSKENALPIAH